MQNNNLIKIECEHPNIIINPNLALLVENGYNLLVTPDGNHWIGKDCIISKLKRTKDNSRERIVEYLNCSILKIFCGYALKDEYKSVDLYNHLPRFIAPEEVKASYYKEHHKKYYSVYNIDYNEVDNYYIINEKLQVTQPVFYLVPCGKCVLCKKKSIGVLKARNTLEFCSSKSMPFFVTLTFDDASYPFDLSRESQTDIFQKFIKRLRRFCQYRELSTKFKYFAVSEFGSKSHRFHYHIIFYHIDPQLSFTEWNKDAKRYTSKLYDALVKVWKKGFVYVESFDLNSGSSPVSYVCKYISKQQSSEQTNKWKSIYMGKDKILEYKDNVLSSFKDDSFEVKNDFTGKVTKIPMYSFIRRMVSPTIVRALPLNVRENIKHSFIYFERYREVMSRFHKDPEKQYMDRYFKYMSLCVRLNYSDLCHKDFALPEEYELEPLRNKLMDLYTILDGYNLDINKLYNDDVFYYENVVITNNLFDVDLLKYAALKDFGALISSEVDEQ